jgi:hypothetical protein
MFVVRVLFRSLVAVHWPRSRANKAEGSSAFRCQPNVVRTIACEQRSNIHGRPDACSETTGRRGHAVHAGRVRVIDPLSLE